MQECYLARRKLEVYWDRVKDLPPSPPSTHNDVRIHPDVPAAVRKRVLEAISEKRRIFNATAETGLPLACHDKPVLIKMKPGATPRLCKEPVWGHGAKRKILTEWAEEKIRTGEFVHCPESE